MGSNEDGVQVQEELEEFNFQDWCKDAGLGRKTESTLTREELVTPETLVTLEPRDIRELGLPIGQRKLFQLAIEALKQTKEITNGTGVREPAGDGGHHTNGATGGQDEDGGRHTDGTADVLAASASGVTIEDIRRQAGALGSAGKALDALFMAPQPSGPTPGGPMPTAVKPTPALPSNGPSYNPSNMGYGDPRTILTLKSSGQKVVHITQFLTESTKKRLRGRRQGIVLGTGGDDNVVIRTEDEHPYRGVTISEWGAANARLMAHLLQTGALRKEDVEYYLAYTTQIFEYASVYEWEAVLEFDFIYRQRQAVHGFLWGQIPPNMQMSLVSRPRTTGVRQRVNNARFNQPLTQRQGSSGNQQKSSEPCWQFLAKNSNCPFGDRCRFSHTDLPPHRNDAKKPSQPAPPQWVPPYAMRPGVKCSPVIFLDVRIYCLISVTVLML